ncbi:heat shock 70 kDa protein-like, partial [Halyomorpha halys]|uniref:heat shock 70 kDa protein-like n=1 Tax=Halyomorpha halys TaxID=286706 RepID=UPI0006D509B9
NLLGTFDLTGIPPAPRGVPKIEVTFDLDANGILNVSAKENSTGKSKNIRIENNKGRLSKEEIERMVNEAERYKAEDDAQRERIAARNQLESYVFSVKQAADEAGDKLSEDEKSKIRTRCDETMRWLDNNSLADKEEYEHKLQELQKECVSYMTRMHNGGSGSSCGQQAGNNFHRGPTVEEVD